MARRIAADIAGAADGVIGGAGEVRAQRLLAALRTGRVALELEEGLAVAGVTAVVEPLSAMT